jgi:hypothetical protein
VNAPSLFQAVPDLRREAEVRDDWLRRRLATVLPEVMRRERLELWIVAAREANEDPVLTSLLPATMPSARRRTVLVFHAPADGPFEALAIAHAGIGLDGVYAPVWDKARTALATETQAQCLRRVVAERDPARIGVNVSDDVAFADGLSHAEHGWLMAALGSELAARTVSAEAVAVGWLERRLPEEIAAAEAGNRVAQAILQEALSARVIVPGVTRAADVAWWLRERTRALGLACWFHPTVSIQRRGEALSPLGVTPDATILPGDLLHADFGLHYLGLATDTQHSAYVLRPGEREAPAGMAAAMRSANRQQDLLAAEMIAGRSGNEILRAALAAMRAEGIEGRVYSHPIGTHGHGAGPMIGRFDAQEGLPGPGEARLHDDTLFAFEMYVDRPLPEWDDAPVRIASEQVVAFQHGRVAYLGGRQERLHLVGGRG